MKTISFKTRDIESGNASSIFVDVDSANANKLYDALADLHNKEAVLFDLIMSEEKESIKDTSNLLSIEIETIKHERLDTNKSWAESRTDKYRATLPMTVDNMDFLKLLFLLVTPNDKKMVSLTRLDVNTKVQNNG